MTELIYYSFECQECLYSVGAFYPEYPKEQFKKHEHKKGKFRVINKGFCIIGAS